MGCVGWRIPPVVKPFSIQSQLLLSLLGYPFHYTRGKNKANENENEKETNEQKGKAERKKERKKERKRGKDDDNDGDDEKKNTVTMYSGIVPIEKKQEGRRRETDLSSILQKVVH
jgi:hypothetical protein